MPKLLELANPVYTTIITMELQKGVVGEQALFPGLSLVVKETGILNAAGRVCVAGRLAGVKVVHATMRQRHDGAGGAINCRIFAMVKKRRDEVGFGPTDQGQPGCELVDELDVQPGDIEVPRMHGVTPFTGTELDAIVRNLGTKTIVLMGVSLNLGIIGAALSAVDLGYQLVVVRDAVVGIPIEYGEAVLQSTISTIATIVTSAELVTTWQAPR